MLYTKICLSCKKKFLVAQYKKHIRRFCSKSCALKGNKYNFKTGEKNVGGYIMIWSNGKYVLKHRWIMEKLLKRKLKSNEVVHHIDGNKQNNNCFNLKLMDKREHRSMEAKILSEKRKLKGYDPFNWKTKERCNATCKTKYLNNKLCQRLKPCGYHNKEVTNNV